MATILKAIGWKSMYFDENVNELEEPNLLSVTVNF